MRKYHGKDLSTNDFTDGYKKKIDSMQTLYRFKGTVDTVDDFSSIEDRNIGDTYKCKANSNTYIWNGIEWINAGQDVDYSEILEQIDTYQDEVNTQINKVNSEVNKKVDKTTTIASIDLTDNITEDELITALKSNIVNLTYPVGNIYISANNTSPAELFGGTWEQIKDRFLLACGDNYSNGSTGGNATHTHSQGVTGKASGNTGAASGNTGSTTLTINHMPNKTFVVNEKGSMGISYGSQSLGEYTGGGQGHTHTLNNHTHTLGEHTHTNPNTNSASSIPPYLAVHVWKRIS